MPTYMWTRPHVLCSDPHCMDCVEATSLVVSKSSQQHLVVTPHLHANSFCFHFCLQEWLCIICHQVKTSNITQMLKSCMNVFLGTSLNCGTSTHPPEGACDTPDREPLKSIPVANSMSHTIPLHRLICIFLTCIIAQLSLLITNDRYKDPWWAVFVLVWAEVGGWKCWE